MEEQMNVIEENEKPNGRFALLGDEEKVDENGLVYAIEEEGFLGPGAYIYGYRGNSGYLAIPEAIHGSPVMLVNVDGCGLEGIALNPKAPLSILSAAQNRFASPLDLGAFDLEYVDVDAGDRTPTVILRAKKFEHIVPLSKRCEASHSGFY